MDIPDETDSNETKKKIKYGSAAVGSVLTVIGIVLYFVGIRQTGLSLGLIGIILATVPYGVLAFLKNRRISNVEDNFPHFLKDLAESKKSGMNLVDAFESARESDYGKLNSDVQKMHNQLTWGVPFPKVLQQFSDRYKDSMIIQEAISIILQSFKSGGNITQTIDSVGDNITHLKQTLSEKNSMMKQQTIIMYVIYFIFIAITVGIYTILVQLMGLGDPGEGTFEGSDFAGVETEQVNFCRGDITVANPMCEMAHLFGFVPDNITSFTSEYAEEHSYGNMAYYKSILFSMLMVQGILSGLVIGQIKDGSPSAGLKHIMVLLPIAFIVFMLLVGRAGF